MKISVKVEPLCGVYDENPLSYLVTIDGFRFLIDCGWNDLLDTSILKPLSRVASTVDAVLLSHPDTLHLGALPYAMKKLGLSAPIFATEPVDRLGLLTMQDQYFSRKQVSDFDLFTLDDIGSAFQNITQLRYSENHYLSGKGEGIVIAPHAAGHMLGGTVWKLSKDGEDVIYAVDFNHKKERLLNGTVLESFACPAVLITGAYNALLSKQPLRREREQQFLDVILMTLKGEGNVLVPVDTAGRVLELILILEQHWEQNHMNYPIYFLSYVSSSTIDYAKSFLEWMSGSIAKSFEHTRDNPFLLKHVTLLSNKSELEKLPDGPKIVLASMGSLEAGFSRDIFVEWAADARSLVLFTEIGQFGTLARKLQSLTPPKSVKVVMAKRVPLQSKIISSKHKVDVKCSLDYVEFEGRTYGDSLKEILSRVTPLKLVLVHGSEEATISLMQHCMLDKRTDVYAPEIGDTSYLSSYKCDICGWEISNLSEFKIIEEHLDTHDDITWEFTSENPGYFESQLMIKGKSVHTENQDGLNLQDSDLDSWDDEPWRASLHSESEEDLDLHKDPDSSSDDSSSEDELLDEKQVDPVPLPVPLPIPLPEQPPVPVHEFLEEVDQIAELRRQFVDQVTRGPYPCPYCPRSFRAPCLELHMSSHDWRAGYSWFWGEDDQSGSWDEFLVYLEEMQPWLLDLGN